MRISLLAASHALHAYRRCGLVGRNSLAYGSRIGT
jgi:hypothetical protein